MLVTKLFAISLHYRRCCVVHSVLCCITESCILLIDYLNMYLCTRCLKYKTHETYYETLQTQSSQYIKSFEHTYLGHLLSFSSPLGIMTSAYFFVYKKQVIYLNTNMHKQMHTPPHTPPHTHTHTHTHTLTPTHPYLHFFHTLISPPPLPLHIQVG